MNGTEPKFARNDQKEYYDTPNPYVNPPSCHVNLLELSRYARKTGKKLVDLTEKEVSQFAIH